MKNWHLRIDPDVLDLAALQRTVIRRPALAYSQLIDYDLATMRPYLPQRARRILDIGSGLAAVDVRLWQLYPKAHFYLLDRTSLTVEYGMQTEQAFYNSQEAARKLLETNGVPSEQIHLLEVALGYEIGVGVVDLALSLFSWGWHYALGTYAEAVAEAVVPDGILIVDVRNRTGEELLLKAFDLEAEVAIQDGSRRFYRRKVVKP